MSAIDSFPSVTDAPERSLAIVSRIEVSLARVFMGQEQMCDVLDTCLAVSRFLLENAEGGWARPALTGARSVPPVASARSAALVAEPEGLQDGLGLGLADDVDDQQLRFGQEPGLGAEPEARRLADRRPAGVGSGPGADGAEVRLGAMLPSAGCTVSRASPPLSAPSGQAMASVDRYQLQSPSGSYAWKPSWPGTSPNISRVQSSGPGSAVLRRHIDVYGCGTVPEPPGSAASIQTSSCWTTSQPAGSVNVAGPSLLVVAGRHAVIRGVDAVLPGARSRGCAIVGLARIRAGRDGVPLSGLEAGRLVVAVAHERGAGHGHQGHRGHGGEPGRRPLAAATGDPAPDARVGGAVGRSDGGEVGQRCGRGLRCWSSQFLQAGLERGQAAMQVRLDRPLGDAEGGGDVTDGQVEPVAQHHALALATG